MSLYIWMYSLGIDRDVSVLSRAHILLRVMLYDVLMSHIERDVNKSSHALRRDWVDESKDNCERSASINYLCRASSLKVSR